MEQQREAEEDQTETMEDEGWAPPDERTATAAGWWPRWLSWRPTSTGLLAETEREMLRPVKTKIHQKMVPIDDKGNQLNTIRLGGGPPLVMIHGFGAAIGFWACNLDAFARHHTVYAFDLLGFGRSSRPRVTAHTAEEAEDVLVESIEAWRKSVGLDSFTLLGHSFGGYLSAAYSMKYPGRVNRLILADPWGVPKRNPEDLKNESTNFRWRVIKTAMAWAPPLAYLRVAGPYGPGLIHKYRPDLIEKFEHLDYDNINGNDTEESKGDKEQLPLVIRYVYHTNSQTPPSGEQLFGLMSIPFAWAVNPMIDRLNQIHPRIPVTFLYGHDTWMDPRAGLKAMEGMKNRSELYVIPRSGHHIYVDNYKFFNNVVLQVTTGQTSRERRERRRRETEEAREIDLLMLSGASALSARDLREKLGHWRVNTKDCLEKEDLLAKAQEYIAAYRKKMEEKEKLFGSLVDEEEEEYDDEDIEPYTKNY